MRFQVTLFFCWFSIFCKGCFSQDSTVIFSEQVAPEDIHYEHSIEEYQVSEIWRIWSIPFTDFSKVHTTSPHGKSNEYAVKLMSDLDLSTSWIANIEDSVKQRFSLKIKYPENHSYGTAYQFFGQVNLFNGNCSSTRNWRDYSRVRTIRVYYNDSILCDVELLDSWNFQSFNIGEFFVNRVLKENEEVDRELLDNDVLTFEVINLYEGEKHKEFGISEFLIEGAKN